MITASPRSPPFATTPSSPSSAYARSPFPDLQNNVISVPLAANLADEGTSSSPSKAEVSLHKTSANSHPTASLTSGLDFEFDSCCLSEINDDPPVSPKLICGPSATAYNYWGGLHNNGSLELIMQQSNPLPSSTSSHITPVTSARHHPSAPSSPSVGRQLVEEKVTKDYGFAYKSPSSAPQTTNLQQKQDGQLVKQLLAQDNSSLRAINIKDQTKSKSAMLERRALMELSPLMMQKQVYLAGRLENNSHLLSSSSSNGSSAMHPADINTSMDQAARSEIIKKHSGDNNKKWAFKDFLRRTVPSSSKGDRHHHNQSKGTNPDVEWPSWQYTSSFISKSAPMSPAASPRHGSPAAAAVAAKHGATIPGRPSPMRSPPPRPPMSPHALHYRRTKASSEEMKRKTFLPYRQSVLGCFGGAFMSHSRAPQQVW